MNERQDASLSLARRKRQDARQDLLDFAHEVNNLLLGIAGSARLLLQGGHVSSEGVPQVTRLLACADRAAHLAEEFQLLHSGNSVSAPSVRRSPVHNALDFSDRTGGSVLVIDDEEVVRSVTREILVQAGYRVLLAESGEEGLAHFERSWKEIRCVLLDLTMPYMSGNLVFARLKAVSPDVRVVLMSGYTDYGAIEQFEGISSFLPKPFDGNQLMSAIRSAVSALTVPPA